MTPAGYLSRVRLRRDVPAAALREVLLPQGDGARVASTHRLIWTLFADTPDRERDFLWREGRSGEFYILSAREPLDRHGLFECDAPKRFAPSFVSGQRLSFVLRVNATVARSSGPGQRGKPCDIVMDAIKDVAPGSRAVFRREQLVPIATRWLTGQGAKKGFLIPDDINRGDDGMHVGPVTVDSYRVANVERGKRGSPLSIGVLDIEGVLEVRDPDGLLGAIVQGFGRAKAFGCGLMLVKRV